MKKIVILPPPFLASFKISLSPFHQEKLRMIDEADYSIVARKVREEFAEQGKQVTDEYIAQGIGALKQYYAVALLDGQNMHAVSHLVDPFWHAHILFTREYTEFCTTIFGQYLHHTPLDKSDQLQLERVHVLYRYTHDVYKQMFHSVSEEWWPDLEHVCLVCTHYGSSVAAILSNSLFAADPLMQETAVLT